MLRSWNVTDFLGDRPPVTLREDFVGDLGPDDVEGRFDDAEGLNRCLEAESWDSEATGLSAGRIGDCGWREDAAAAAAADADAA